MSGNSAAADDEITKFGDSTEFSPPTKKVKTDPNMELVEKVEPVGVADTEDDAVFPLGRRAFLPDPRDSNDSEYNRQVDLFMEQVEKTKGYYMDMDQFDYRFAPVKFEWGLKFDDKLSSKELMDLLIKTAIEAENEDSGTQLEFVEYVSCNVTGAAGFCFYITLLAKDVSLPNPEPKVLPNISAQVP